MLRMFVTGWSPYSGGSGMPQRARTSSRPTSVVAHDRQNWSGKMAGRSGRLPVETIVEIRALRNEITHMHMIDAAIATERDETLWLN